MDLHEKMDEQLKQNNIEIAYENIDQVEDNETFAMLRNNGFGASESSVILGVNPFKKINVLIQEKLDNHYDESISQIPAVKMGKDLEPMIIEKLNKIFEDQEDFSEVLKPHHMYKDPETGLTVNFDGVVKYKGKFVPIEIKTISYFGHKNYSFQSAADIVNFVEFLDYMEPSNIETTEQATPEDIKDISRQTGIPAYYYTQLQQQIAFLGSEIGFLAVLNTKTWDYFLYKIKRDDKMIEALKTKAAEFYQEIKGEE